jgi:hypothetical protein
MSQVRRRAGAAVDGAAPELQGCRVVRERLRFEKWIVGEQFVQLRFRF